MNYFPVKCSFPLKLLQTLVISVLFTKTALSKGYEKPTYFITREGEGVVISNGYLNNKLAKVDFPDPEGPTTATIVFAGI